MGYLFEHSNDFSDSSNASVQVIRVNKTTPDTWKSLHEYIPLKVTVWKKDLAEAGIKSIRIDTYASLFVMNGTSMT